MRPRGLSAKHNYPIKIKKEGALLGRPLSYISANVVIAWAKPEATLLSHRHGERSEAIPWHKVKLVI